jgi:acyl carrier protein
MNNRLRVAEIEDILVRGVHELRIIEHVHTEDLRTKPLFELGLDSLSALHLREFVLETFQCDIPESLLRFEIRTLRECAEFVFQNSP